MHGLGRRRGNGALEAADVTHAHAAVDAALDAGSTVFDHVDMYCNGKAEAVFGVVLAERPELAAKLHLQTKCGIFLGTATTPGRYDSSAATIRAAWRIHWPGWGWYGSTPCWPIVPTR